MAMRTRGAQCAFRYQPTNMWWCLHASSPHPNVDGVSVAGARVRRHPLGSAGAVFFATCVCLLLSLQGAVASPARPTSTSNPATPPTPAPAPAHEDNAACSYQGVAFSEGVQVPTEEPCLNCTCTRGSLLCYLRVCPKMPDPPPVGCIILQRYRTCCRELICNDLSGGGNRIESRAEPDTLLELPYNQSVGCISNGSVYAEGSAMSTSSQCEHCFCLRGQMRCVKPRCLLPVRGCEPRYERDSCCPVRYNCSSQHSSTTSTTIVPPTNSLKGCHVEGRFYAEGENVVGAGHLACENCYCIRGMLRCEPLSCAPPLLGCEPVIPQGYCCAVSYNCSGTIEVKPNTNYSQFPDVSKNYAQLRKDQDPHLPKRQSSKQTILPPLNTIVPTFRTSTRKHSPSTSPANPPRHLETTPTIRPTQNDVLSVLSDGRNNRRFDAASNQTNGEENDVEYTSTDDYTSTTETQWSTQETTVYQTPTTDSYTTDTTDLQETTTVEIIATTPNTSQSVAEKYESKTEIITVENCTIDEPENKTVSIMKVVVRKPETSTEKLKSKTKNNTRNANEPAMNLTFKKSPATSTKLPMKTPQITTKHVENITQAISNKTEISVNTSSSPSTLMGDAGNGTVDEKVRVKHPEIAERLDDELELEEIQNQITLGRTEITPMTTTQVSTTIPVDVGTDVFNASSIATVFNTSKVATATLAPLKQLSTEIEAILNITKSKDQDYEFDYNEPSLPPSLPNLKIIPFVAADAVSEDAGLATPKNNQSPYPALIQDKMPPTGDPPIFRYDPHTINLFSPPVETEGGFLPREPPLLGTFYDNGYHTTNIIDITSGTAVPSITNPPKANEDNCISKEREYRHGELLSAPDACILCLCFFGDIVCQQPKCPPLKPGCHRLPPKDSNVCCGHVVCENESPTVVLDRIDVTSNPQDIITVADGVITPDPFRDVIRTEPAPDLQSLIGDIMPFLKLHKPTASTSELPTAPPETTQQTTSSSLSSAQTRKPIQITTSVPLKTNTDLADADEVVTAPIHDAEVAAVEEEEEEEFSFDKVLAMLFSGETSTKKSVHAKVTTESGLLESRIVNNQFNYMPVKFPGKKNEAVKSTRAPVMTVKSTTAVSTTTTTTAKAETTTLPEQKHKENHQSNKLEAAPNGGVGLLKLAGCNIYGRMYRVGRIITELSGPCLECMCTDVGVQCRPLTC